MKNLILLLSLAFPMILGAQQWEMKLDMPSVFVDGVINESDEAIVAGLCYNTDDEDIYYGTVFKVKKNGEQETLSFNNELKNVRLMNIIQLANGSYFVSGIEQVGNIGNNKVCDIHILLLDKNLEMVKHERLSPETGYYFGVDQDAILDEDKVIMVCSTLGDDFVRFKPTFFKFNADAEQIATTYPTVETGINDYSNLNVKRMQLKKSLDGSGYVLIARFTGSGTNLLKYDKSFRFESTSDPEHPEYMGSSLYNSYEANSDYWMSDEDMMIFGSYCNYRGDEDRYEVIISDVNLDGTINKYEVITSDSCHTVFSGNNAMCYVNDSTIYGGYHSYSNAVMPFHTQLCMFNRNMEILGTITIEDCLGYSSKMLLSYANGDLLLLGSVNRTNSIQNVTEATIMKFTRNDFINATMDVNEVLDSEITSFVYPNPTEGDLNIDIRGIGSDIENRVRIMDVNGRTMMSRIIRGCGNVLKLDVGALDSGVYFYEIFNAGGTVTKGKFVRE